MDLLPTPNSEVHMSNRLSKITSYLGRVARVVGDYIGGTVEVASPDSDIGIRYAERMQLEGLRPTDINLADDL